ncbi:hypothetical protein SISNIDRAFT_464700 [Sistotremastrum niveocremeum HHB9708]|uniref:Uncharacterized protein n=1 Tax=Sistotremastrum niveocremeum HHB9708 TaxID=1314777 RepID=A0A164WGJ6_9AGAM|nr:hypothetical protein SISNIDRAFT_464700 [Sistotremastrum niveocremeum HHB9708]
MTSELDSGVLQQLKACETQLRKDSSCSLSEQDLAGTRWSVNRSDILGSPAHVLFGSDGRRVNLKLVGYIGVGSHISVYGTNIDMPVIDEMRLRTQEIVFAIHPLGYQDPMITTWNQSARSWMYELQQKFLDTRAKTRNLNGIERTSLKHGNGTLASLPDPAGKFQPLSVAFRNQMRPIVHTVFLQDRTLADPADYGSLLPIGTPVMVKVEPFVRWVRAGRNSTIKFAFRLLALRALDGSTPIDRQFLEVKPTPSKRLPPAAEATSESTAALGVTPKNQTSSTRRAIWASAESSYYKPSVRR